MKTTMYSLNMSTSTIYHRRDEGIQNLALILRSQESQAKQAHQTRLKQRLEQPTLNTLDGLGLTYLGQGEFRKARATYETALQQLTKIKDDSNNYNHLFEMVSGHLQNAQEQVNDHHQRWWLELLHLDNELNFPNQENVYRS